VACYLWAYHKTRFELFRDRAKTAIRMTMAAYPDRWRWTNGLQQERARMLLAWRGSPASRTRRNTAPGCGVSRRICWPGRMPAARFGKRLARLGQGQMHPPQSNEAYGSGESPLLQQNGDPVCDLLYTCNFALLGLHEAAATTGDPFYAQAEERLARFLCRIQSAPSGTRTRWWLVPRF